MLHNISLYPGLTEEQLCRFFPEKEATAKTLLAHMLKEGRIFFQHMGKQNFCCCFLFGKESAKLILGQTGIQ